MDSKPKGKSKLTKTRLLLAGGALTGLVWAGTFASFSDTGQSGSSFTAGTLDLLVGGDADDAHAFTNLEMQNLAPGDAKYAPLAINNTGTLALRYSMTTAATNQENGLASALTLEARSVASTEACDSEGTGFAAASDAVVIPPGALSAGAITNRTLAAGVGEVLCFKVALSADADNALQGASTVVSFNFTGNQV